MKINTDKNCNIVIYDDTEYPINGLSYRDSVSLYVVQLNESNLTTILYNKINDHSGNSQDPIYLSELKEGYITVCHIILPKYGRSGKSDYDDLYVKTKDYITNSLIDILLGNALGGMLGTTASNNETTQSSTYNNDADLYYFSDGRNIYKEYLDETIEKVNVQELLEVNAEACNFVKEILNFFSVCYLRRCFVALSLKIFNNRAFDKCFTSKVDSQLTYKRDLVWAALNVILYMIDSGLLAEALRLVERISGCNGLCSKNETGIEDCGCN